ncbi:MAG: SRPBCC family protein [Acidimicrobiales bacterium]|nr:SRPBCC family protein [Acidimicrobiales bacterium]
MALKLEYEVIVDKPIQEVWDYSNNPDNLHLWLNDFLRYEQLTGDRHNPKVGDTSNHTYSQGKSEFTMLEKITAYDPPHHIKLFMTSKMMDMEIVNNFEAVDADRTRLFAGAEFVRLGLIMKVMFLITPKKKMQADHKKQIDKLKELIEAA